MSTFPSLGVAICWLEVLLLGRRHQNGVDQVDRCIGSLDAAADDLCIVDHQVVTATGDLDRAAFSSGQIAGEIAG